MINDYCKNRLLSFDVHKEVKGKDDLIFVKKYGFSFQSKLHKTILYWLEKKWNNGYTHFEFRTNYAVMEITRILYHVDSSIFSYDSTSVNHALNKLFFLGLLDRTWNKSSYLWVFSDKLREVSWEGFLIGNDFFSNKPLGGKETFGLLEDKN